MIVVKNRIGGLVLAGVVAAVAMGLGTGLVTLSIPVMGAVLAVLCGLAVVMIRSALTEASVARGAVDDDAADPLFEDARPFPQDIPVEPAVAEEPAEAEAHADRSVRLVPVMPPDAPTQTDSWAGGCPQLPADVDWPAFDGAPARFLAQIDCSGLPPALWDGLGVRDGALAFFAFEQTEDGAWPVRVLHANGARASVEPPESVADRPCWPLQLCPARAFAETEPPSSPDWARLHEVAFDDPAYLPFDWTSAALLMGRLKTAVQIAAEDLTGDDRADLIATARQMADLVDQIWARRGESAFDAGICADLMQGLSGLSLPVPGAEAAPLLQDVAALKAYFAPFEEYCRQVYTRNPADLPDAQRALFEPLWTHNAHHEAGTMGSEEMIDAAENQPGDPVLLLELPSSELLGWTFGAGRSFRVYAARAALEQGDLSECWASVAE